MSVYSTSILLSMTGDADMREITEAVNDCLKHSGLNKGILVIFCPSSTSSLTTIEYEPGCLSDLRRLLDEIINPDREYAHNARWGDGNGHAHVRAALMGPSLSVPFNNNRLTLGTWQQIIFLDFDNKPRQRELVVQIIGE